MVEEWNFHIQMNEAFASCHLYVVDGTDGEEYDHRKSAAKMAFKQ